MKAKNNNINNLEGKQQSEEAKNTSPLTKSSQYPAYGSCQSELTQVDLNDEDHGNEKKSADIKGDGAEGEEELSALERLAKRIPCLGIMLALCASLFLGSAGMLVKMTNSVHGIQVAVFRAMIQLLIYLFIIFIRHLPYIPDKGERLAVFGRAFLGSASITFSYYALKLIPLGDATTIRFSLPIWTLIISYLVLNESCSIVKILAVVVSISGVVLIAKPDDVIYILNRIADGFSSKSNETKIGALNMTDNSSDNITSLTIPGGDEEVVVIPTDTTHQLEGCLLALSSSICLSMSLIALRLCKKTPAEITILWLSIFSILIGSMTLVCMGEWRFPNNWMDVIYVFLNGLCGAMGQWFITSALKVEQSGVISLARTFDIQVAFLYSAFLLKEQIRATSIVGSVLVSGGVVAVVIPKLIENRRARIEKRRNNQQVTKASMNGANSQRSV